MRKEEEGGRRKEDEEGRKVGCECWVFEFVGVDLNVGFLNLFDEI